MDVDIPDEIGWTPLHHACYTGSAAAVEYLLESKANINAQNKNGEAPLHLAFGNGHMEVIRLLIQADPPADRQLRDAIGFTPLQYATLELAERMNNAGWAEDEQEERVGAPGGEEEADGVAAPNRCTIS